MDTRERCIYHNELIDPRGDCGACEIMRLQRKHPSGTSEPLEEEQSTPANASHLIGQSAKCRREDDPPSRNVRRRAHRNLGTNEVRYHTAFGDYDGNWYEPDYDEIVEEEQR